jgi:23S rRNA pseudouridine1911/1915/1917 synthase
MSAHKQIRFTANTNSAAVRLDRALRNQFSQWGRQAVQRQITAGKVRVNGRIVRLASWEVRTGDQVEIADPPPEKPPPPTEFDDAWLIAAEDDLIAVNKPAGLLSEPTRFAKAANLLDLARSRFGELVLFHRLDRDTSGVMILSRPGPINRYLDEAFQNRAVVKEYLAVVDTPNRLQSSGTINARLGPDLRRRDRMMVVPRGGQLAVTEYVIEQESPGKQLVRLRPQTGRTHQLRVHLASLDAPILGDRLYGRWKEGERLMLHAERIELPALENFLSRSFSAPLPAGFDIQSSP